MSTCSRSAAEQFTRAVHSALSLSDVGDAFLATADSVVDADVFGLYRFPGAKSLPVEVLTHAEREFLDAYEERGRVDDPVLEFVATHRRPIDSTRAAARSTWQSSGACAVLADAGLTHSLEAPVLVGGELIGTINFARAAGGNGFNTKDLSAARMLSEQLSLAVERALRFEVARRRTAALEAALDRVSEGIVVSTLDAEIVYSNRSAREIIEGSAPGPDRRRPAVAMVSDASDAMREGRRVHSSSLRLADGSGHVVAKSWLQDERHGAVVTMMNHAPSGESGDQPALSVLSAREREIARFVSEGLTSKEIGQRAFITENTVKQHLKRIFAKTDVRNRAELVQLIWSSGVR